ncbi:MAG: flagellar biosynthetic protein FliQ [Deltaproteobacteria bacterium RIFCSPLOWO2_12_FULL_44_12]|nr:MAG: flagellar biosynthetic protein FliQ [Deltaproteobacteria bacterium RIFCSPHIGHO2_01_FULL_43_49]OGQ16534.1 MAG: flagellar biosynthetic protein FliQ [Deltaproteobacteria bacterium RIFCSPHIGHO2_02_FULL_44_53]OGQ28351.1 MAG: flagellar biosynthetic protein FliQ [Deltaproteobacteria bacterium RIFCSPHIGHO2_12_FULL_44_21]OGQ32422.1 MAG: flagellar biosynthetic protein FliQ [Deltaproteobacteria bacterium RIFCSPLOWO2_01_FULL_45_74]OGQ41547.1 MAG: flagellar biosynthetic protein FliQ [Deltaproteobact
MDYFVGVAKQALFLTLIITAPPVLIAMLVGLIISILQATTQIQEQTLTFVPKLVAIVVVLVLTAELLSGQLLTFTHWLFNDFAQYVK